MLKESKGGKIAWLTVLLLVLSLSTAWAYVRPNNPTMDYVPQNVGIYDTYYDNFQESDCRVCHGASTAEVHHNTQWALQGDCLHCHEDYPDVVPPERDCKVCHVDGGPIGDLGYPHHRSDASDSDQCVACHNPNLLVETNTVEPPSYPPSSITPTPQACENCHWPSGSTPHEAATLSGDAASFLAEWQTWTGGGGPKPTTYGGNEDPQPIEANGPCTSGTLNPDKPYMPGDGTHHEVDGNVYSKCYNCHGTDPTQDPNWDPEDPYLIRMCENCHDIGTLHSIAEHVTDNNIYRVGDSWPETVTANQKCYACHGDNLGDPPPGITEKPVIVYMEPNFGPPGMIVTLYADPNKPFGEQLDGDRVQLKESGGSWTDVPIYSWTENQIQFKIPGWTFSPGNLSVRVHKEGIGNSAAPLTKPKFTLHDGPKIANISPPSATYGQDIALNGSGFRNVKEKIYVNEIIGDGVGNDDGVCDPGEDCTRYGYSTYVELYASNDVYRVTKYPGSWTTTDITIRLKKLLDVNTGLEVPPSQLYVGEWQVRVVTDYFIDDGDGVYNEGMNGLDPDDELLHRVISDPKTLTITDDPYINKIIPKKVPYGNIAKIVGYNFGTSQGGSVVEVCNKTFTKCKIAKIRSWTNTKIKFKVPKFGTSGYPKAKWVRVLRAGSPSVYSNAYKIKIIEP